MDAAPRFSKLHKAAFALETIAHLQQLERALLPHAEFLRKVDEAMKAHQAAATAVEVVESRYRLLTLIVENSNDE